MIAYPDASFLFSLYGRDSNSQTASAEYQSAQPTLLLTSFGEFELVNAFEALVFRRAVRPATARAALRGVQADIESGALVRRRVPESAYERAIELSRRHTRRIGARALDILHIAIALELGAEVFLTFDRRQHKLASAASLRVRPAP